MIGLKRHTVQVVAHDPAWAGLYESEARAIRAVAGHLLVDLQHVGSTSVPDLPAKPILDVALAITSEEVLPELVRRLVAIGYLDRGDAGSDGGYLLVRESAPEVRSVHLHIVREDDPQWRNYLAFRDALRRRPEVRARYGALKRELAARYPNDRKGYTSGKHVFIQEVLAGCAAGHR